MPGYLDELLRMLGQAQVPPGVMRAVSHPGMWGADMDGEALRRAMATPSRPQPTMDELLDEQNAAELRRMVEMSMELNPFYDATPYKQVLGPNASQTTGVPVPVTRDNPMAYGNSMQSVMPAQDMEPANMDIRSLLAALAGAGGGFAAGRLTAPPQMSVADLTHTMPDGTVMPGSEEDMYREAAASMQEDPNASSAMMMRFPMDAYEAMPPIPDGQRLPGSMRMPMPPPYKTPPQLQRLNNLRMP